MREIVRLLNIPERMAIVDVMRTLDGFFLGRTPGDTGYNAFLGRPSFHDGPGRQAMRDTWTGWTFGERRRAMQQAKGLRLSVRTMLGV